jgi:hypothetical protein
VSRFGSATAKSFLAKNVLKKKLLKRRGGLPELENLDKKEASNNVNAKKSQKT